MAHSAQKPIATWNPARDAWEETTTGLFCEHSDVFSETWPASGMTLHGQAYELPMWAHRTGASGSSSSPGLLLKTPTAQLAVNGGSQHPDKRKAGGHGPALADEIEHLLPTPKAVDGDHPGIRTIKPGQSLHLSAVLINLVDPLPAA